MKDIQEIVSLIEDWEQVLLKIEQTKLMGDVHLAFQKAHSLKGSLALGGYERASQAVHATEDKLDKIRRSGDFSDLNLDPIFGLIDELRQAVSRGEDLSEVVQVSQPSPSSPTLKTFTWGFSLSEETLKTIDFCLRQGVQLWVLQKTFKTTLSDSAWARLPLFRNLESVGSLYSYYPSPDTWDRQQPEVVVSFLFSSDQDHEGLTRLFYDPVLPAQIDPKLTQGKKSSDEPRPKDLRLKILLVEDDALTRMLLSRILSQANEVEESSDGLTAWNMWLQALESGKPFQMMILDQMIPELSGQELLVRIRDHEARHRLSGPQRLHVYINTALDGYEFVKMAFKNQADGYFVKPFSLDKILGTIEQLRLELRD